LERVTKFWGAKMFGFSEQKFGGHGPPGYAYGTVLNEQNTMNGMCTKMTPISMCLQQATIE